MNQLWLFDHNLSSINPNDMIQKRKIKTIHRGPTSRKCDQTVVTIYSI